MFMQKATYKLEYSALSATEVKASGSGGAIILAEGERKSQPELLACRVDLPQQTTRKQSNGVPRRNLFSPSEGCRAMSDTNLRRWRRRKSTSTTWSRWKLCRFLILLSPAPPTEPFSGFVLGSQSSCSLYMQALVPGWQMTALLCPSSMVLPPPPDFRKIWEEEEAEKQRQKQELISRLKADRQTQIASRDRRRHLVSILLRAAAQETCYGARSCLAQFLCGDDMSRDAFRQYKQQCAEEDQKMLRQLADLNRKDLQAEEARKIQVGMCSSRSAR